MKERFAKFMIGRNGNDQLNLFLLILCGVCLLLGTVTGGILQALFRVLTLVLIVLAYFRMFSRDVYKRREENSKYLSMRYTVFAKLKALKALLCG